MKFRCFVYLGLFAQRFELVDLAADEKFLFGTGKLHWTSRFPLSLIPQM